MSVASADLIKAINTVWDASTLDASFKALWNAEVAEDEFPVLHDQLAGGGQPFPFCIFEMLAGSRQARMSRDSSVSSNLWEIRDVPVDFRVHATDVAEDARGAKQIAAHLVEEIMKVFGGHATTAPMELTLDNGGVLSSTYQSDRSVRESEDHFVWTVSYIFRVDVPVAV